MHTIKTTFNTKHFTFLDEQGIKYNVISSNEETGISHITMEVDGYTLIKLYTAGQKSIIDEMMDKTI